MTAFSNNIHTCNLALNRDLCRIDSWSKQWQVMFSAEKNCDMVLSLRPSSDPPNPLTFSGSQPTEVRLHTQTSRCHFQQRFEMDYQCK